MEKKKIYLTRFIGIIGLAVFIMASLASSSSRSSSNGYKSWSGSDGQRVLQHSVQAANGGTYVGRFSSEAEAKKAAARAGFKAYNYYYETGECFGY